MSGPLEDLKKEMEALLEKARVDLYSKGLSYKEVAAALKVNKATVRGWFNGLHKPSPKNLLKLSQLLDVPPAELARLFKTVESIRKKIDRLEGDPYGR